jgi:hypothetical protein
LPAPGKHPILQVRRGAVETNLTYEEGHAHVAAIRLLKYREHRPPTIEEVAGILGSKVEITLHRLRTLQGRGIVAIIENPFETHVSVENHLALEELPVESDESVLSEAVEDFRRRQDEKADEMMRVFEEKDADREKKEKHEHLEDDLRHFKKKKVKKAPWEKGGEGD